MVGAILTQQTTWSNVEKAIANLKGAGLMGLGQISSCSERKLAGLIRPSGYYRQKAKRLRGICREIAAAYGTLEGMFRLERGELRRALLGMKGIGNETADSIILYAAEKPIFVIDAYTERVMKRLSGRESAIGYTELQAYFTRNMAEDLDRYKEAHAQFVELGKRYCRPVPLCGGCPLRKWCAYPKAARAARTAHLDDAKG